MTCRPCSASGATLAPANGALQWTTQWMRRSAAMKCLNVLASGLLPVNLRRPATATALPVYLQQQNCLRAASTGQVESKMGAVAGGLWPSPRFPSHRVTGRPDRGSRFAHDSPVEGDGFEPSVPREDEPTCRDGFVRRFQHSQSDRDRGFESCLLHRRVHCEPGFRGRSPSMTAGAPFLQRPPSVSPTPHGRVDLIHIMRPECRASVRKRRGERSAIPSGSPYRRMSG